MAHVDALVLKRRARQAYERGRVGFAVRVLVVVVPTLLLAIAAGVALEACVCLGLPVAAAAVGVRWYGRDLGPAVTAGVWFGSLVTALALAVTVVAPAGPFPWWEALGFPAGLAFGWSLRGARQTQRARLTSTAAAVAMAAPGCLAVGAPGVLLLMGTLAAGSLIGSSTFGRGTAPS
jgi:hypothetical protein